MESNTKYCEKCKKSILANNFLIHQAMCRGLRESQLFRSRVISPEEQIWNGPDQIPIQNCNETPSPNVRNPFKKTKSQNQQNQQQQQLILNQNPIGQGQMINRGQTMLPNQNNINHNYGVQGQNQYGFIQQQPQSRQQSVPRQPVVEEQRFPCSFCGYRMTMAELDTHPNSCKIKKSRCEYCNSEFPVDLMKDHHSVCTEKQQLEQIQQRNRRGQSQDPIRRRNSQRQQNEYSDDQTVEHYHFSDQQGQQMCARVTIDQNGNRITNTRPVNEQTNNQTNANPFLSLLGMFAGFPASGSFNVQMNQRNGGNNQRVNYNRERAPRQGSFEQMIMHLLGQMNIAPQNRRPLEKDLLKKLPVVTYNKSNPDHQGCGSCTVCMTDFEEGDQLILLPCGHLFNKQCIVPWLKNSSLCPNCRQAIKVGTKPSHSANYQVNNRNSEQTTINRTQNITNNQPLFQSNMRNSQNTNRVPNIQTTSFVPGAIYNTSQIPPNTANTTSNQTNSVQGFPFFSSNVNNNNNNNNNRNPFGNRNRNDW